MTLGKIRYQCPECKGILSPWNEKETQHVCDVCGLGKCGYDEFDELQRTKMEIV